MDEFYVPTEEETPVTIVYPTGSIHNGEFVSCIQTRTHYYGTPLSFEEIAEKLLEEGFIDKSDESNYDITSIDPLTCEPYDPGQHEFRICETEDWGFFADVSGVRPAIKIALYFNEIDLYHPDDRSEDFCETQECADTHNVGWDYEQKIIRLLELNAGE